MIIDINEVIMAKDTNDKRDKLLKIRITIYEQETLLSGAKVAGLPVSDYVRGLLFCGHKQSDLVATNDISFKSVATKRIDTPDQAKKVIASLPKSDKPYHREPRGGYGTLLRK